MIVLLSVVSLIFIKKETLQKVQGGGGNIYSINLQIS
jgi:hypothetical protein